jgi:hypothetical protein
MTAQAGNTEQMRSNRGVLGILQHSFGELIIAFGAESSHFSLGPIFGTTRKRSTLICKEWRS